MKYRTVIVKVASHVGVPGSELADTLAKRGVLSRSSIGRFSSTPPQSLTPPSIDFNHSLWTEKTTTEQDTILTDLLTNNLPLISLLPQSAKKPWISPSTLKQIDHFQKATSPTSPNLNRLANALKNPPEGTKKTLSPIISFLTFTEAQYSNGRILDISARTLNRAPLASLTIKAN